MIFSLQKNKKKFSATNDFHIFYNFHKKRAYLKLLPNKKTQRNEIDDFMHIQ